MACHQKSHPHLVLNLILPNLTPLHSQRTTLRFHSDLPNVTWSNTLLYLHSLEWFFCS